MKIKHSMHIKFVDNISVEGTVYLPSKQRILSSMYKMLSKTVLQTMPNEMLTNTALVKQLGMSIKVHIISHTTENYATLYSRDAQCLNFAQWSLICCGSSVWN